MTKLEEYRATFDQLKAAHLIIVAQVESERKEIETWTEELRLRQKGQIVIQQVAQNIQNRAQKKISKIVSRCLESVFDEPYEFNIEFESKRGRTEPKMVFVRDGEEVDPLTASGGGVIDVAAFAARLARLLLSLPKLRRLVILDEPFRFVSEHYRERVRDLLLTLSKEMKIQFVMVTHADDFKVGKVVEL